ncbi:hypothetical protein DC3_10370 [Deinococcus cellulosilyticus NBRC 106333 = KACC 11606]|uniref:Uncharacterized protein n=2 Tax=Deinococcus cellulosilyticus TaxID=401558 RepID=A0A511MXT2_DEIC1|nr:hypothetical protein DC3_10370 [Deinococcus cellulosilyticus NBRC 106333 = KACC 11606]
MNRNVSYTEVMDEVMVLFAVLVVILLILIAILRSFDQAELTHTRPSVLIPIRTSQDDPDH